MKKGIPSKSNSYNCMKVGEFRTEEEQQLPQTHTLKTFTKEVIKMADS